MDPEHPKFNQRLTEEIGEILEREGFVEDTNAWTFLIKKALRTATITFIQKEPKFSRTVDSMLDSRWFKGGIIGGILGLNWIGYVHNNPGVGEFTAGFLGGFMVGSPIGRFYPEIKDSLKEVVKITKGTLGFRS